MKIDHVALFCRDLEAMRQFFLDHFEAVSNEQYHNLRTGLRTYILSFPDGGAKLELMQRPATVEVASIVASTDKIAVAVIVVATATVRHRFNQITETCPADADVVGAIGDIHVAVDAVLNVAVVDPYVSGSDK